MNKKIFTLAILTCLCFSQAVIPAYPRLLKADNSINAPLAVQSGDSEQSIAPKLLSKKTEKELKTAISKVYGLEQTDEIYSKVLEIAQKAKENRSQELKKQDEIENLCFEIKINPLTY